MTLWKCDGQSLRLHGQMLPCGLGSQAPEQGVCGETRGVMTTSAPRRAEVGEGKPRGEGQMAPCWASLTLGRVVGTMGPAEAPLAPTRGARVRFPRRDGEWAGVREVLTSPNLGHLQPREQLLLWRPPHWDGGPSLGTRGDRREGVKVWPRRSHWP